MLRRLSAGAAIRTSVVNTVAGGSVVVVPQSTLYKALVTGLPNPSIILLTAIALCVMMT